MAKLATEGAVNTRGVDRVGARSGSEWFGAYGRGSPEVGIRTWSRLGGVGHSRGGL